MNECEKQALDFMREFGWTFTKSYLGVERPAWDEKHDHAAYRYTFRKRGKNGKSRTISGKFYASLAATNECTAYDVLACLVKSDPGTLDEFISEYGIEIHSWEDAKRAMSQHKACLREYKAVRRLVDSEAEMEALQEIS